MQYSKVICIISNSHSTTDVRLYHKLAKSLCKIATVYVLGAMGFGVMPDIHDLETNTDTKTETVVKPNRIIVPGLTPFLRLIGLYRKAMKLKPDLVICIEPLTMYVGLRIRKKTGCKLVYDAHEYYTSAHAERYRFPFNHLAAGMYYLIEHSLQEQMDLTIAVNEDIFKLYNLISYNSVKEEKPLLTALTEKYLLAPKRLGVVCPNYPTDDVWNDSLASCRISSIIPETRFDIIYLGGITEERGIIKMLHVINLLRQRRPGLKALFVGPFQSEDYKNKFNSYLMDNNLNSFVFWRDLIPHYKVCAVLKQVKVGLSVLHPRYKRYRKALPLKLLEYLAAGVPVVANDFPQNMDIIEKYGLGYCVQYHKEDIANAIDKLLNLSDSERQEMADKCRKVIREHFLWSKVEPVLLDAVNFVLNGTKTE